MNNLPSNQPCPACGNFNNRGVTIDAVIMRDGKILLGKRKAEPFRGYWALVGGYVEWDESVEDAVKREVGEETGLEVVRLELIGVYSNPDRHPKQSINIAYKVEVQGEPRAGDDIGELRFVGLEELPELAFDHKKIIEDGIALEG